MFIDNGRCYNFLKLRRNIASLAIYQYPSRGVLCYIFINIAFTRMKGLATDNVTKQLMPYELELRSMCWGLNTMELNNNLRISFNSLNELVVS